MILLDPIKLQQFAHAIRPADSARPLGDAERAVLARARHLSDRDRMLVELVYHYGLPLRRVGELLDMSAGTVSRAAKRLWRRITQPIAVDLCNPLCQLSATTLAVALDHFLRGRRAKEIAVAQRLPLCEVRDHIQYAHGWHRGISQRRA